MTPKQVAQVCLNRLGLTVTRFPPPHLISRRIKDFIRENRINLVLDVGAHHGEYSAMLRRVARYTGPIASFEPCAESFHFLSMQMSGDSKWRGHQFGLSDTDSGAVLNTYGERGVFNSLLHLKDEGARAYHVDTSAAVAEAIQLHTIDTIWSDVTKGIHSPRVFLKIDTQGHDVAVMLGAAIHLEYIYGIQSELPAIEIYNGMKSMPETLDFYRELGFSPIGFYPVNTPDTYDGVPPEFDVILKRFRG